MISIPSANRNPAEDNFPWGQAFLVLLILVTAWRLFYLVVTPLDLVPDEAYYWDWGRHFSWGYYSKPPLIAWLNGLSSTLFGATPFTVRLPAVLCGSISLMATYGLASRMFNPRVGFFSTLLAVIAPGSALINFVMTIDAPLVCCWTLALYTLWRGLESKERRAGWYFMTIILCGIGLLAKQMMLVFPVITILFLVFSQKDRHILRTVWPYLIIILPLTFLLPDLWWNKQHGWITFKHTAHHFEGNHTLWRFLSTLPDFVGGQMLLMAPLAFILIVALALVLVRHFKNRDRRLQFLFLFSALPLAVFAVMSLRQRIYANWPAAFYPAAFVLIAAWACGHRSCKDCLPGWRRLFPWTVYSGLFLTVLIYSLTFYMGHPGLGGRVKDPFHRLKGWQKLGTEVSAIMDRRPAGEKIFLLAMTRQTASELAFYVHGQPRVYLWNDLKGLVTSQYDLWPGPIDMVGKDALIIAEQDRKLHPELQSSFKRLVMVTDMVIPAGTGGSRNYQVYLGHNLLHWPR